MSMAYHPIFLVDASLLPRHVDSREYQVFLANKFTLVQASGFPIVIFMTGLAVREMIPITETWS